MPDTMDVHILKLLFAAMTIAIILGGSLLNKFEEHIPAIIVQSYRFGKFAYKGKSSALRPIEVPKRWFRHFYLFAMLFSCMCLMAALNVYLFSGHPMEALIQLLNYVSTSKRTYSVSSIATLLALSLLSLQCIRRFYETWFISIFSCSKINLAHYLIGYLHYFGTICAILAEAPGFTPHSGVSHLVLRLQPSELHLYHIVSTFSFLWAFYHQYQSAVLLAKLRKDSSGNVITQEHRLPEGGLFSLVSSPHMFCEVILYFSLMVLLWGNSIMPWITAWVFCNQVETALLTHWWYQSKFKDYPKQRTAIFPFVL